MKSIIKRISKFFWRGFAPIRRPLIRKVDGHLENLIGAVIEARVMPTLAHSIHRTESLIHLTSHSVQETDLVLNSLVRELVRLHMQIEVLQQQVDQFGSGSDDVNGLSLVDRGDPCDAIRRQENGGRARVG